MSYAIKIVREQRDREKKQKKEKKGKEGRKKEGLLERGERRASGHSRGERTKERNRGEAILKGNAMRARAEWCLLNLPVKRNEINSASAFVHKNFKGR